MIDNLFPCDIGAFVTIQEAIMKLRTIGLISTLTLGLFAGPLPVEAQQAGKVYRIAILAPGRPGPQETIDGLRQGLRDLGYIEGQNIIIEYRFAERKYDRFPQLAAELVSLNPDVIIVSTTPGVRAVKKATTSIPIVVGSAGSLAKRGIVASLARPGGNITGMTFHPKPARLSKQLEVLKEAVPKISYVAFLVNPANPGTAFQGNLEDISRMLGIRLQRVEARGVDELETAFSAMAKSGANGLLMANDSILNQNRKRIVELALKGRLPSVSQRIQFAEAGGLIAYGTSLGDMWRRAATHVDKILKGTKPADIPVERPTKFNLVINLKTAKKLGLTFSPQFLSRADKLIK